MQFGDFRASLFLASLPLHPASLLVRLPAAKSSLPVLSTCALRPRPNLPLRLASSPPSGSFHPDSSQHLPSTLGSPRRGDRSGKWPRTLRRGVPTLHRWTRRPNRGLQIPGLRAAARCYRIIDLAAGRRHREEDRHYPAVGLEGGPPEVQGIRPASICRHRSCPVSTARPRRWLSRWHRSRHHR